MSKRRTIIILHETVMQSWLRDIGTFAMTVGVISVGVILNSDAMQWVGAAMLILTAISRAGAILRNTRMTSQQAADILRDKFGVFATPRED